MTDYVPDVGHAIWLSPGPTRGHEQAGRRLFLVLTPRAYNAKTALVVGVPITSKAKGYPFEVVLDGLVEICGVVLADQVNSLDWRVHAASFGEKVPAGTVRRVRAMIATLLQL